jgi:hypothetical protein
MPSEVIVGSAKRIAQYESEDLSVSALPDAASPRLWPPGTGKLGCRATGV